MSITYELEGTLRKEQGTGASRRLRGEGKLPAVIYGNHKDAVSVYVDHNVVFYAIQKEEFHSAIIKLKVDGVEEEVIVRDFQMHPFKQMVSHIDFQRINKAEEIKVKVPLNFINGDVSPAVKLHGGRISHLAKTIEVLALPGNIPTMIDVDLSKVVGGQILHISTITLPENVTSVTLKRGSDLPIVAVSGSTKRA